MRQHQRAELGRGDGEEEREGRHLPEEPDVVTSPVTEGHLYTLLYRRAAWDSYKELFGVIFNLPRDLLLQTAPNRPKLTSK